MHQIRRLSIRSENESDRNAIRLINEAAFARGDEADLVDALHAGGSALLSLVAELDSRPVGHLLFSRMSIETKGGSIPAVALAPIAVVPESQGKGVGSRLIQHGIRLLQQRSERIVIVLGHPSYYQRFGFSTEKARFLESPFPPDAFMALELELGALEGVRGQVKYPPAFGL